MRTLYCPECKKQVDAPELMGGEMCPLCRTVILDQNGGPPIGAWWTKEEVEIEVESKDGNED